MLLGRTLRLESSIRVVHALRGPQDGVTFVRSNKNRAGHPFILRTRPTIDNKAERYLARSLALNIPPPAPAPRARPRRQRIIV